MKWNINMIFFSTPHLGKYCRDALACRREVYVLPHTLHYWIQIPFWFCLLFDKVHIEKGLAVHESFYAGNLLWWASATKFCSCFKKDRRHLQHGRWKPLHTIPIWDFMRWESMCPLGGAKYQVKRCGFSLCHVSVAWLQTWTALRWDAADGECGVASNENGRNGGQVTIQHSIVLTQ